MALKHKARNYMKVVCGKGYCNCKNKKFVHGRGFMDIIKNLVTPVVNVIKDNKDTIKSGIDTIGNVAKISDSTATIVKELMKNKRQKVTEDNTMGARMQNIVDKINAIKLGSGFAIV